MSYGTNSELIAGQLADAADVQRIWGGLMYNVINHGLVGGGVANDTSALQALINKAISAGRRTIFFPHNQYFVTSLANADQVDFVGDNSKFVGGYAGTIANLGDVAALKAEFAKEVAPVFNVKGYGAKGDLIANDTAAIKSAISDCEANGGGTVYFPKGYYLISSSLIVSSAIRLVGDGWWYTQLRTIDPTVKVIIIDASGVGVSKLAVRYAGASPATSGCGIELASGTFAVIDQCQIASFYDNINVVNAYTWTLNNSHIAQPVRYGLLIRNVISPDGGDQVVQGNLFDSDGTPLAGVRHESGGGLKFYGNKILGHKTGYDLQIEDGGVTSIALINNNSIEMQSERHIRIKRKGTTGTYNQVIISNNQHNHNGSLIEGYYFGDGINGVNIVGNESDGPGSAPFMNIVGGTDYLIDGNKLTGWGTGIKIGSGVSGVRVGINDYEGIAKPIEDNVPISATRPTHVFHEYKKYVTIASDTAYTNLFKLDMAQFRGCRIELTIEGILMGVSAVSRNVVKVVARSGAACALTDVSDTNGSAVIDMQYDVATTSGSVYFGIKRNTAAGGTSLQIQVTLRIIGHAQGINVL